MLALVLKAPSPAFITVYMDLDDEAAYIWLPLMIEKVFSPLLARTFKKALNNSKVTTLMYAACIICVREYFPD